MEEFYPKRGSDTIWDDQQALCVWAFYFCGYYFSERHEHQVCVSKIYKTIYNFVVNSDYSSIKKKSTQTFGQMESNVSVHWSVSVLAVCFGPSQKRQYIASVCVSREPQPLTVSVVWVYTFKIEVGSFAQQAPEAVERDIPRTDPFALFSRGYFLILLLKKKHRVYQAQRLVSSTLGSTGDEKKKRNMTPTWRKCQWKVGNVHSLFC